MGSRLKNFEAWQAVVSAAIKGDPLWRVRAYRLALFAADIGWRDVTTLMQDRRTRDVADQLYRALGSIGANIAEGYSRGTGRDRARFYEYALGSARESRTWYHNARHVLGEDVSEHRMQLLTHIIRLLLTTIPQQRNGATHEPSVQYAAVTSKNAALDDEEQVPKLPDLLTAIPQGD
jgi:four helix bundle protein